jgi:prophage antirepressor-like protein
MTTLVPFNYSGRQVRTVTRDGEPWFVARDVCTVLEIRNVADAVATLDEDEKGVATVDTPGGDQRVGIINEPGLYSLILRSRKPEAKTFKRWVTHEVLPAIRKTGRYEVGVPKSLPEALRAYANEVEAHEATRAELVLVKPRAEAWDVLADTGSDFSVREAAYILNRDPAINTGERRLFGVLRTWGLIDSRDRPYSNHATHVTLRPRTRTDRRTQEEVPAKPQVRVTVAGLTYLHKRMGGSEPLNLENQGDLT